MITYSTHWLRLNPAKSNILQNCNSNTSIIEIFFFFFLLSYFLSIQVAKVCCPLKITHKINHEDMWEWNYLAISIRNLGVLDSLCYWNYYLILKSTEDSTNRYPVDYSLSHIDWDLILPYQMFYSTVVYFNTLLYCSKNMLSTEDSTIQQTWRWCVYEWNSLCQ